MNASFKILFPTGYQVSDIQNDNIDINVLLSNGKVYFATLFTLKNIDFLMKRDNDFFFWATDMVIVSDLSISTIRNSIVEILKNENFREVLAEIGNCEKIFSKSFSSIYESI